LEAISKIPKNSFGSPQLPLDFGDFVLESLGTVIHKTPFVTDKYIYPVGFRTSRIFASMVNPEINVKYTCTILNSNDKPLFVITPEDEPLSIQSHSPSSAWKTVFKKLAARNPKDENARKSINGASHFGLTNPIVSHLIRELYITSSDSFAQFASPSSPSGSPIPGLKKRKSSTDLSSSEDLSPSLNSESEEPLKFPRVETVMISSHASEEIVFHSREELDDLEFAVTTLSALKFCTVY